VDIPVQPVYLVVLILWNGLLHVTEEVGVDCGESIMALFKLDYQLWGKSNLLIHQVVDMGLELPLIFKRRDFSCKVDLAENIFKPLEPL
jgi:hypothetical protein